MFKPELWQSHNEYRTIVNSLGKKLSRNNPRYQFDTYSKERQKLLSLNLDPLLDYLPQFYSPEGRPAKNQAQILRSLILFTLLFNRTDAKTSLTAWVRDVLPRSISLACICGFPSLEDLPPLGSYYDLMNRLWIGSRQLYTRSALLPAGKNGKKPDKTIGSDGKLAEEPSDIFSARHTVDLIRNGSPASDNPEAALQEIFSLLAVLPSIRLGLIDLADLTISGDGTAVVSHTFPAGIFLPAAFPALSAKPATAITLTRMLHGDGTAIKKYGISVTPYTCFLTEMNMKKWNSPLCSSLPRPAAMTA